MLPRLFFDSELCFWDLHQFEFSSINSSKKVGGLNPSLNREVFPSLKSPLLTLNNNSISNTNYDCMGSQSKLQMFHVSSWVELEQIFLKRDCVAMESFLDQLFYPIDNGYFIWQES